MIRTALWNRLEKTKKETNENEIIFSLIFRGFFFRFCARPQLSIFLTDFCSVFSIQTRMFVPFLKFWWFLRLIWSFPYQSLSLPSYQLHPKINTFSKPSLDTANIIILNTPSYNRFYCLSQILNNHHLLRWRWSIFRQGFYTLFCIGSMPNTEPKYSNKLARILRIIRKFSSNFNQCVQQKKMKSIGPFDLNSPFTFVLAIDVFIICICSERK